MDEFSRTEWLIGREGLNRLRKSTVLVLGVGGVGSHCIEALARSAVGHLILADHDRVSLTNINRQSIAYHSTIGQYKTLVMKKRILDINPGALVETREEFILPENLEQFFSGLPGPIDYIIDAIDTVSTKLSVVQYAQAHEIPMISSMGTGNKLHPELFEITDIFKTSVCPLCRVMRRELKARGIEHLNVLYSKEQPVNPMIPDPEETEPKPSYASDPQQKKTSRQQRPGSVSFVPPAAGLLIAGEVLRQLSQVS